MRHRTELKVAPHNQTKTTVIFGLLWLGSWFNPKPPDRWRRSSAGIRLVSVTIRGIYASLGITSAYPLVNAPLGVCNAGDQRKRSLAIVSYTMSKYNSRESVTYA
ncbi:hypothetical protein J6590_059984 [Homalodisca vitripennis]|nr:hypothetical protein J6590_059984 [Homalodisca vitripennis]